MSNKQCMYVLEKTNSEPVKPADCCEKIAFGQDASGRWYCSEHLNQRRSDRVAASNGDGLKFSFQS